MKTMFLTVGLLLSSGVFAAEASRIEIRRVIPTGVRIASVYDADGEFLAAARCEFSHGVDVMYLNCKQDEFQLSLMRVLPMPVYRGTLTSSEGEQKVMCHPAEQQGPNGVDGPVLEDVCTVK